MIRRFLQLAIFLFSLLIVVGFARAGECESHVVQKGEWLEKIAQANGMSWQAMWEMNKERVKDPNLIYPEQSLCVAPLVEARVAEEQKFEAASAPVETKVVKAEASKVPPVVFGWNLATGFGAGFAMMRAPSPEKSSQVVVGRIKHAEQLTPAAITSRETGTVSSKNDARVYKYVDPKPVVPKVKPWVHTGRDKCTVPPENIIPRLGFTKRESESLIALVDAGVYTEIDISAGDYFTLMCSGNGRLDPRVAAWKDGRKERARKYTIVGDDGAEKSVVIPYVCGNVARVADRPAVKLPPAPVVEESRPAPMPEPEKPAVKKPCGCPELNIILSLEPMSAEEKKEEDRLSRPAGTADNTGWWEHPATRFNP
jgi:hypothetical protein